MFDCVSSRWASSTLEIQSVVVRWYPLISPIQIVACPIIPHLVGFTNYISGVLDYLFALLNYIATVLYSFSMVFFGHNVPHQNRRVLNFCFPITALRVLIALLKAFTDLLMCCSKWLSAANVPHILARNNAAVYMLDIPPWNPCSVLNILPKRHVVYHGGRLLKTVNKAVSVMLFLVRTARRCRNPRKVWSPFAAQERWSIATDGTIRWSHERPVQETCKKWRRKIVPRMGNQSIAVLM